MSDGGALLIDQSRGPPGTYQQLRHPLPSLPKGQNWLYQEETKKWQIVSEQKEKEATVNRSRDAQENFDDYHVHTILPTDTMVGVCLRYKVTPTKLRQVNRFSGTNLWLAHTSPHLMIPKQTTTSNTRSDTASKSMKTVPDSTTTTTTTSHSNNVHRILAEYPQMSQSQARAYLSLCDNNVSCALQEIVADLEWESGTKTVDTTTTRTTTTTKGTTVVGLPTTTTASSKIVQDKDSNTG